MYKIELPLFKKGSILKKEMLENLKNFPRDFSEIYYKDYGNGIISGCDISIDSFDIIISRGIIKHNNKLYILDKDYKISYENISNEVMLKIIFLDERVDNSFSYFESKIELSSELSLAPNELELCRFKMKEGARLRENHIDFSDFSTEFNTLNIINTKYSSYGSHTLHPKIIKNFANFLLQKSADSEDYIFSMLCLNSNIVQKEVILQYINKKLTLEEKDLSNNEIYKMLNKIYRNIKDGKKSEVIKRQRPNVILVD